MHGQSPASPEGGRYLSRVGGGVVALGQTGERHPWISFFFSQCDDALVCKQRSEHGRATAVKAGLCATTDDTGCIIPGANAAAAQFCFALHYRHKCKLPKNVHDMTSAS